VVGAWIAAEYPRWVIKAIYADDPPHVRRSAEKSINEAPIHS